MNLVLDGREMIRQAYFRLAKSANSEGVRADLESAAQAFTSAIAAPKKTGYVGAKEGVAWATMWLGVAQVLLGDPHGVSSIEKAYHLGKNARGPGLKTCHRRSATERAEAARLLGLDDVEAWWDAAEVAAAENDDKLAVVQIAQARRSEPGRLGPWV